LKEPEIQISSSWTSLIVTFPSRDYSILNPPSSLYDGSTPNLYPTCFTKVFDENWNEKGRDFDEIS